MTLIPPMARLVNNDHSADTNYAGKPVVFRATCPCGKPNVLWITSPSPTVGSRPFYDIRCKHKETA